MRKETVWRRGSITIFVSLLLSVFLILFQVCFQSVQDAYWRSQVEDALELTEFSVLSEYQRELLETYDLFFLDLGYGSHVEDLDYLKQRIRYFMDENLSGGRTLAVDTADFSRATDEGGMVFYEQAVSVMKEKTGVSVPENYKIYEGLGKLAEEKAQAYADADRKRQAELEVLKRRREEEEKVRTNDPADAVAVLKSSSVLHLVLKEPAQVSSRSADLSRSPSGRVCLMGTGARGKEMANLLNDAIFLVYLQKYLTAATDFLAGEKENGDWLDYQLEYVIAGRDSDMENLEEVCKRLLVLREGLNYAYLLGDGVKVAECEAVAAALVGITMIPGLVEAVKQVLLLTWAFAESVVDVQALLSGKSVAFQKDADSWCLSLDNALELRQLQGTEIDVSETKGLSYRDYLGILLVMTAREKKAMRCLDVIEGVLRNRKGGTGLYLDQCVDGFTVCVSVEKGRIWESWRNFCYEW